MPPTATARRYDPATSADAADAAAVPGGLVARHYEWVTEALRRYGPAGATASQIASLTRKYHPLEAAEFGSVAACRRLAELCDDKVIHRRVDTAAPARPDGRVVYLTRRVGRRRAETIHWLGSGLTRPGELPFGEER